MNECDRVVAVAGQHVDRKQLSSWPSFMNDAPVAAAAACRSPAALMIRRDVTMDLEDVDSRSTVSPNHFLAIGWYCLMLDNEAIGFIFSFHVLALCSFGWFLFFGSVCLPVFIILLMYTLNSNSIHQPNTTRQQNPLQQSNDDRTTMVTITPSPSTTSHNKFIDTATPSFHSQILRL